MTRLLLGLRQLNWHSAILEIGIVFVGVVVALAAGAWWEDRQDEARAVAYLEQIAGELAESESELDEVVTSMLGQVAAAAQLTRAAYAAEPPTEAELRAWALRNSYYAQPVLTMGTARAMVATADIRHVSDRGLRTRIVSAVNAIDDYETWSRNQVTEWFLPAWHDFHPYFLWTALVVEGTPGDSIDARALRDSTYMLPPGERVQPFALDIRSKVRDPGFHAIMLDTYISRADLLRRTEAMRAELAALREEIERGLTDRR